VTIVTWLLVAACVVVGAALRAWYLFHHPITSDEAIGGLMAQQALHGHFTAFYWGQSYGGVEPYLIALQYKVFGFTASLLGGVATVLAIGSGLVTWRIARRLVSDGALAALAGAVAWAIPTSAMSSSTYEWGFRGVALLCGLLLVLLSLRVTDGHQRARDFVALGLVAGVGWWSSPEIVYFVLPAAVLLVQSFRADPATARGARWVRLLLIGVAAACIGSLPWLWANLRSGFASFNQTAYADAPGYTERLRLFFHYSVGMLFSLRATGSGAWLLWRPLSVLLLIGFLGSLAVAVVLCLRRGGRSLAIALGVLAFPLLVAYSPASWFWQDGRYVGYVVPLFVLVLVFGCADLAGRLRAGRPERDAGTRALGRLLAIGLATALVVLSVANFAVFGNPHQSFFANWGDPNRPTQNSVATLESAGVRDGYADYWVAYRLDFLSGGKLQLTVVGTDPDRWAALNHKVATGGPPAWIFVPPNATALGQFTGTPQIVGPAGISEAQFIGDLQRLGIGYRTVNAGLVHAVVPDRAVPPRSVGVLAG
jgi:4-amino-4-deoxy-L-arabinose transferase-like glycosyltransferase